MHQGSAGRAAAVPGGLPGSCRRCCRFWCAPSWGCLRHKLGPAHAAAADAVVLPDGRRYLCHALSRRELDASTHMIHDPIYVAASMAIAIAASGLALAAGDRPWRAPLILSAAAFWYGHFRHALHGHDRRDALPLCHCGVGCARAFDGSPHRALAVAFCVSGIFFLLLLPDSARVEPQELLAVATAGPSAARAEVAASPAAGWPRRASSSAVMERLGGAAARGAAFRHLRPSATAKRTFLPSSR